MAVLHSKTSQNLCTGHKEATCEVQSRTDINVDVLSDYSHFITQLSCANNHILQLPEAVFDVLPHLKSLEVAGNFLEVLPKNVSNCKHLKWIGLSYNNLKTLPEELIKCEEVVRLDITGNLMTELPACITKMKSIERLYINNLMLRELPESIGDMSNLHCLYASGNCFTKLPSNFSKLKKLTDLALSGVNWYQGQRGKSLLSQTDFEKFLFRENILPWLDAHNEDKELLFKEFDEDFNGVLDVKELSKLSATLFNIFPRLGYKGTEPPGLELEDCPALKTPPREILSRGFKAITAYLRRLATGSVECKRTKLMLVGLGGAGKTSLCRTLMNGDSAKNLTGAEDITDGIDIANWTVSYNDNQIMYSVWDFAGQTVYYNTHQFFLSKRAVYLLLWNVRLGFEHAGLHFWLSSISVHAPKAPIFVIGTHIDQVNKAELPMEELEATYPQISGFYFISSLSGKGIDKLKADLYTVTLDQDYMGEKIPLAWLDFEKSIIATRQKGNDVIDYNIIEKKAADCGIVDKTEVAQALQFLHDLGAVQHFNNHYLKSRVVINPQWIVDVMACVVSVKESHIKEGRLKQSDLGYIWKDYPAHMHLWLLRLTEEFDLTFPLEGQNVNLVPCLLPEKVAKYDWPEADRSKGILENKMIYKFDHLPAGLFNRAQVRLHQFSDSSLIWKRGSFLKKKGHIALVQQIGDQEMIVMAQGPTPENILFMVHEAFESLIMEFFQGVHYDYQLPCPECLKQGGRDPHLFNASTVRRAVELKAPFLQCLKFFHTIMVTDMQAFMPPDTNNDYDVHMAKTMSGLQEMKKSLATDIFISYCEKDAPKDRSKVIHPATVHDDLTNHGYTCWYPESSSKYSSDALARALIDSSVFLVFMSPNYAKDTQCCDIFQYAKLTLGKPFIVVAVGDDFSWQKSKIGIFLQDVVFVNMINSKKAVYKDKLNELLQKLDNIANTAMLSHDRPECFVSYAWSNSQQACNKGTKYREGALGDADPRELKEFIEEEGKLRCWIDIERVGMTGLFEEIVKGLLQARIVVACISKEYTESQSCQKEFLYALNALKLPVVCAIVGTGDDWKYTSVGMMAFNLPQVSFQMKSEGSKDELLKLINEKMLPEKAKDKDGRQQDRSKSEQNQISFQELYELAQRKFLRQVGHYAASHEMLPYPRLFVVDIVKKEEIKETEKSLEKEGGKDEDKEAEEDREKEEMIRKMGNFRHRDYCVYTLCEYDEGWHSVEDPFLLPEDFGRNSLEDYAPYLARITAIMKHSKDLVLNCLSDPVGKDYVKWLHEMSLVFTGDFMNMYQNLRNEVYNLDEDKKMSSLSRCRLPSGKIKWLCSKHCKEMKATVLSDDIINKDPTSGTAAGLDHMIEYLRTLDADTLQKKFTNSDRTKRTLEEDFFAFDETGLQKYDTSRDERLKQNQSEEILTPKAASKRMSSLPFSLPFKSRPSKLKTRASQHNMMASISVEESENNSISAQNKQNNVPAAVITKSAQLDRQVSNVSRDLVQTDRQTQPKLEKHYNTIEMSQPKQSKPKTSSKTCVLM
ncbi:hypothetical protein FSP39_016142 [Pinctada imbricata]|uniref:non-specific serine/threonine protein kinase n=1 Tax=Pinctada imbricata TaxID=66713 RepID=A0AA88YFC3_PINIB|nr:hypothetical protein FSP39_016142 [Pinctada imbricata]